MNGMLYTRYELVRAFRNRRFFFFSLGFPLVLFIIIAGPQSGNDNFAGSSGTWASSNPLVMYVNQRGLTWSLSPGAANITYTSPAGVKFSEWTMHVVSAP